MKLLVLTRKKGESIIIGDQIEIVVVGIEGETVKIGIQAPKQVEIYRKELYLSIQNSNKEALSSHLDLAKFKEFISNKE